MICFILLVFHLFAFASQFYISFERDTKENLLKISGAVSGVTSTLIVVFLIITGYESMHEYNEKKRKDLYASIAKQVSQWFEETGLIRQSDYIISNDMLRHFKIEANCQSLFHDFGEKNTKEFCKNVHYELTHYPSELIYGIHFELDDKKINSLICKKFMDIMNAEESFPFLMIDKEIPKRQGWIFLIRKINLTGDFDKDIPLLSTHARHFVELVCHTFPLIYCSEMMDAFLHYINE